MTDCGATLTARGVFFPDIIKRRGVYPCTLSRHPC